MCSYTHFHDSFFFPVKVAHVGKHTVWSLIYFRKGKLKKNSLPFNANDFPLFLFQSVLIFKDFSENLLAIKENLLSKIIKRKF